jgi:hypothetical protein
MIPITPRPSRKDRRRHAALRRRDDRWLREYWSRPYPSCYICDTRTGPFMKLVAANPDGTVAQLFPLTCPSCFEELKKKRPELGNLKPLDGIRFEESTP